MLPVIFKSGFMVYIYLFFFVFYVFVVFGFLALVFLYRIFLMFLTLVFSFFLLDGWYAARFFFLCVCVWERKLCNSRDETERSSRCQIYGHEISALWSNPFVNLAINLPVYGSFY